MGSHAKTGDEWIQTYLCCLVLLADYPTALPLTGDAAPEAAAPIGNHPYRAGQDRRRQARQCSHNKLAAEGAVLR